MQEKTRTHKTKKHTGTSWIFLILIVFLLSSVMCFSIIPRSLAAQVTMEVYQQEGRKAFGQETSLDIFNDPKLGGEKLVHPFSKGTYTFEVYNNSNSNPLPYSLTITGTNLDDIPLFFSLQKNGEYIFGDAGISNMLPLSEIVIPEKMLDGRKTDFYTIEWVWKTESDLLDTAIGNNGTQLYQLFITATGTIPEIDNLPPKTGDVSDMLLWVIIMLASLILLFILIFWRRNKDADENNKAVTENM